MSLLKVNSLQDLGADAVVTDGVIASSALPAGSILQVVSATKTDIFTTTSTSYVDITGLSVSITPTSATSKIWVIASVSVSLTQPVNNYSAWLQLVRDSTAIGTGTPAGSRPGASWNALGPLGNTHTPTAYNFLDSPSTTSSVTYKVQGAVESAATLNVNRTPGDGDNYYTPRLSSTITVMEVAG